MISKIIGLDLSISETGVCLFKEGKYKHFVIKSNKKKFEKNTQENKVRFKDKNANKYLQDCIVEAKRIKHVAKLIIDKIQNFKPDVVILENYFLHFSSRGKTPFMLAELHSIIKFYLLSKGTEFAVVTPTHLKKFVTGKGNSKKNLMIKETWKRWKVDFTNDNECDAFCLVQYFLRQGKL